MTQRKDRREIEAQIAEADRIASEGIGLYRQGAPLHATIREGDDVAKAMEKALAEHVARHPEDAGRTVADFKWIISEVISELLPPSPRGRAEIFRKLMAAQGHLTGGGRPYTATAVQKMLRGG